MNPPAPAADGRLEWWWDGFHGGVIEYQRCATLPSMKMDFVADLWSAEFRTIHLPRDGFSPKFMDAA